jgi:hypothetical protein
MTKVWTRGAMVFAATLMALAVFIHDAGAVVLFPRIARRYTTWFARAMDECVPPGTVSVFVPGLPPGGCVQANTVTQDGSLPMKFAKLTVDQRGRVALFGVGFVFGTRMRVELVLRVTKSNVSVKHLPGPGTKNVTFQDLTILCGNTTFGFVTRPNGAVAGQTTLASCLGPANSGLAGPFVNIEILDASLINVDTGKVFARPGIVR